jgi:AAA+ superfamily predicted ATPase
MGDLVLKREWKKPTVKKPVEFDERGNIIEEDEPIDLAFILNLLDGTLESEGRILAISTNFPERIDTALIRPGRIDMIIEFKKCSNKMLKEMMESFYEIEIKEIDAADKWTPAEVNQIFFRNFNDPEQALKELKTDV